MLGICHQREPLRRFERVGIGLSAALACAALTGCNTVGTVASRAESMNKTTAAYSAAAVLYNIVRSKNAEPLNFVSLTGITGHNTATAGLGVPTVNFGPDQTPTQRLFIAGPNSVSGSESNDFVVNVVDDPASYAALSRPVDPATIGFIINQYSNRDLVFFLTISKIQIMDKAGKTTAEYWNEPYVYDTDKKPMFGLWDQYNQGFYRKMRGYVSRGLTVSVDQGFVPSGVKSAKATFCFAPKRPDNSDPDVGGGNICQPPDQADETTSPRQSPSAQVRTSAGAIPGFRDLIIQTQAPATNDQIKQNWVFNDPDGNNPSGKVHLYTRSVFGMYRYLGEILALREINQIPGIDYPGGIFINSPLTEMLHVVHDTSDCWTSVNYDGLDWCVPKDAIGTKRTFALLHQLFQLYATPNTTPATSTVRVTQ